VRKYYTNAASILIHCELGLLHSPRIFGLHPLNSNHDVYDKEKCSFGSTKAWQSCLIKLL